MSQYFELTIESNRVHGKVRPGSYHIYRQNRGRNFYQTGKLHQFSRMSHTAWARLAVILERFHYENVTNIRRELVRRYYLPQEGG